MVAPRMVKTTSAASPGSNSAFSSVIDFAFLRRYRHPRLDARRLAVQQRVRELVAQEKDDRVKIWALVTLGGERTADIAREYSYRDQSGVGQLLSRLDKAADRNPDLRSKLDNLKTQISTAKT